MFQRNCPECGITLFYNYKYQFDRAEKNNTKCKINCYGILLDPINNKFCSKCKTEKPKTNFNKLTQSGDGLNSSCMDCRANYRKTLASRSADQIITPDKKICDACQKFKTKDKFHNRKHSVDGLADDCKRCSNKKRKSYYANLITQEKIIPDSKKCPQCSITKSSSEFYTSHRSINGLGCYCKACDKVAHRTFIKTNIQARIRHNIRSRLRTIIINNKKLSAVRDLGCSIDQLIEHLENKFYINSETKESMTWDNYGHNGWHIDHIIPLSSFDLTKSKDIKKACHYTNLQPLWAKDNLKKGSKVMI